MDKTLQQWYADCDLLYHPKTAAYIKSMTASIIEARAAITPEERKQKYSHFQSDKEVASEICAARLIKVSNDVLAQTFALPFFELMTLEDTEWPYVYNRHIDKNFSVLYIGQNGGAIKKQVVERQSKLQFLMQRLSTPEYEFPLWNLQTGEEDELDNATQRITYELMLKLDQLAQTLIDAGVKTSGLRNTLNLHPAINAANIPDANSLDLSGTDVSGKWSVEKIKQVLDYAARFSADTSDQLEDLQVKAIYMPSPNKRDIWDFVDLVSAYDGSSGAAPVGVISDPKSTVPHEMKTEIWRSNKLEQMFGYKFAIVTKNTLATATNYVSMNRPCGYFWHKPSQDTVVLDNSPKMQKVNKNSIWMAKTIQMTVISEWTKNMMKVIV